MSENASTVVARDGIGFKAWNTKCPAKFVEVVGIVKYVMAIRVFHPIARNVRYVITKAFSLKHLMAVTLVKAASIIIGSSNYI